MRHWGSIFTSRRLFIVSWCFIFVITLESKTKFLLPKKMRVSGFLASFLTFCPFWDSQLKKPSFLKKKRVIPYTIGKYLGHLLNKHAEDIINGNTDIIAPFTYNHLGSFAYVGNERAVLELPIIGSLKGLTTFWLWRGYYASDSVSLRMRTLICFDWMKRFLFGRDTSRI